MGKLRYDRFLTNTNSLFVAALSMQAAIEAKLDNRPGPPALKMLAPGFVPEAPKLDTLMKAALIYSF